MITIPNWVENELTVSGSKDRLQEFKQKVAGDKEALDADKIIPYPAIFSFLDRLNPFNPEKRVEPTEEESSLLMEAALAGCDTKRDGYNQGGYEWCIANWGTKWGFFGEDNVREPVLEERPRVSKLHYSFETAWSSPIPLIKKMGEMFPDLSFELRYWECGMAFKGELHIRKGEVAADLISEYRGRRGG